MTSPMGRFIKIYQEMTNPCFKTAELSNYCASSLPTNAKMFSPRPLLGIAAVVYEQHTMIGEIVKKIFNTFSRLGLQLHRNSSGSD